MEKETIVHHSSYCASNEGAIFKCNCPSGLSEYFKTEELKKESPRTKILLEANKLTSGDRDKTYGPPIDNLSTYADLCSAYLAALPDPKKLDATDGSVLMILAKISRIPRNKLHRDNYVDGAAYMAIAGECAEILKEEHTQYSRNPIHGRDWKEGPRDFTKGESSQ